MPIDPEAEYRRVREKYAPARLRDLLAIGLIALAILVANLVWDVDWWLFAGTVTAFVGWEATKWRLRRNARDFVERTS